MVLTWPTGNQNVRLGLDRGAQTQAHIGSVDVTLDGRALYLALLSHRTMVIFYYLMNENSKTPIESPIIISPERFQKINSRMMEMENEIQSLKSQMKKADKSGAKFTLLLGDEEIANGTVTVKDMSGESSQVSLPINDVAEKIINQILHA